MKQTHLLIYLVIFSPLLLPSCVDEKRKNEQLIDRINLQIQSGNYTQIYEESSSRANYKYSKEKFIERMTGIIERMREVDESLTMQKYKGEYPYADEGAFPPSQNAYRYIEKNEKRIGINIKIDSNRLLDFCIYTEKNGTNENPPSDELCVYDFSRGF